MTIQHITPRQSIESKQAIKVNACTEDSDGYVVSRIGRGWEPIEFQTLCDEIAAAGKSPVPALNLMWDGALYRSGVSVYRCTHIDGQPVTPAGEGIDANA